MFHFIGGVCSIAMKYENSESEYYKMIAFP